MIDAKEAKRLAALEQDLVRKFRRAEKEERVKMSEREKEMSQEVVAAKPPPMSIPAEPSQPPMLLTVSKAKQLDSLKSRLQNDFADVHAKEMAERRENERKFEAITRTIKEQQASEAVRQQKAREAQKQARFKQLMRFRPRVASTPSGKSTGYMGQANDDDDEGGEDDMEVDGGDDVAGTRQNQSMKQLMDTKVVTLGSIGARYFPRAKDDKFGIYYDEQSERPKIGSEAITFDHDDIVFVRDKKTYKGTEGLWRLLTVNDHLADNTYTAADWNAYKEILIRTDSLYQRNDPRSGRPKSSQGRKWKRLIKPVWDALTNAPVVVGSGLAVYNDKPVEYRYINNMHELIGRLNYIHAQETAGNNNFQNEKLSLVRFVHDRMEELVQNPNGIKYLVRCLSALPEKVIEGSGLLNDIINKLPFELHAPRNWNFDTYNFCGPGTKLRERLARGDKGVNPLDEACKEHDIWYRDHKNTEDRWVADKVLQQKAWDRVTSADADLNERAVGLATTGGMWLKRKLGMGLGTSGSIYPDM